MGTRGGGWKEEGWEGDRVGLGNLEQFISSLLHDDYHRPSGQLMPGSPPGRAPLHSLSFPHCTVRAEVSKPHSAPLSGMNSAPLAPREPSITATDPQQAKSFSRRCLHGCLSTDCLLSPLNLPCAPKTVAAQSALPEHC